MGPEMTVADSTVSTPERDAVVPIEFELATAVKALICALHNERPAGKKFRFDYTRDTIRDAEKVLDRYHGVPPCDR